MMSSQKRTIQLLGLYQQILKNGGTNTNNSPEQLELRLSGLVVEKGGELIAFNQIYASIFDKHWVDEAFTSLRPYEESLKAWLASARSDESRLLYGQSLIDAQNWSIGKNLSPIDYNFLYASQEAEMQRERVRLEEQIFAKEKANQILQEAEKQAQKALLVAKKSARIITVIALCVAAIITLYTNYKTQDQLELAKKDAIAAKKLKEKAEIAEKQAQKFKQEALRQKEIFKDLLSKALIRSDSITENLNKTKSEATLEKSRRENAEAKLQSNVKESIKEIEEDIKNLDQLNTTLDSSSKFIIKKTNLLYKLAQLYDITGNNSVALKYYSEASRLNKSIIGESGISPVAFDNKIQNINILNKVQGRVSKGSPIEGMKLEILNDDKQYTGVVNVYVPSQQGPNGSYLALPSSRAKLVKPAAESLQKAYLEVVKEGGTLLINDMFRSAEVQKQLYEKPHKNGIKTAQPGVSTHEAAIAIDINLKKLGISLSRFREIMRKWGWLPRPGQENIEPDHFEFRIDEKGLLDESSWPLTKRREKINKIGNGSNKL